MHSEHASVLLLPWKQLFALLQFFIVQHVVGLVVGSVSTALQRH